MRATRDLRRRRLHLARKRGARLAPGQNTNSQDHLPASGTKIAYHTTRDGVAARCADPAGPQSRDVDLARSGSYEERLRDVDLTLVNPAKHPAATTRSLRHTVPGSGKLLSRVRLSEIHQSDRFPRGQACASSCRLGKGAKESAGKRCGTSGTTLGTAHLQGAFSEAALFCVRDPPAGQKVLASLEKTQRQGNALTILAQTWARAVYDMLKQPTACDRHQFLHGEGRGVGELDAELDDQGMPLPLYALHETHACVTERRCA
jgi:transposase